MTSPLGTDLAVYWNGTAITGTSGSVTRSLKRLPEFSAFTQSVSNATLVGAMDVIAEQGDPRTEPMRCLLHVSHKVSGLATALAVERALMDEMRTYQAILNPFNGAGTLRVDRTTAAGGAISCEVPKARIVSVPRYGLEVVPGDGMVEPTRGYLETTWELWCPLPYFYDRVASTDEVAAGNGAANKTLANPGIGPCGVRFEVKAGSVVSSPTQVTVTNTTTGETFKWRKLAGVFADADYVDWFHTDPREEDHINTSGLGDGLTSTGSEYMELVPGNNVISAQRTGGTGQVVLTMSWKPRYLSV